MSETAYPFLYYGAKPNDWLEGANDGHVFEIAFAKAPDAAAKAAIAGAFETSARGTWVRTTDEPWQWHDRWALLFLGEASDGDESSGFFEDAQQVMRAIHAAWPIAEVVFHGATDAGKKGWDAWTVQQQAAPGPGPDWPLGLDLSSGPHDRAQQRFPAPGAGPDAGFEAARAGAR
jgi:hypothetical protein